MAVQFKASRRGDNSQWSIEKVAETLGAVSAAATDSWQSSIYRDLLMLRLAADDKKPSMPDDWELLYVPSGGASVDLVYGQLVRRLARADRDTLSEISRLLDELEREKQTEHQTIPPDRELEPRGT